MAFTVSTAPLTASATGMATTVLAAAPATDAAPTTEATGSIDRPTETSLCAWAAWVDASSRALAHSTAAVARRRCCITLS